MQVRESIVRSGKSKLDSSSLFILIDSLFGSFFSMNNTGKSILNVTTPPNNKATQFKANVEELVFVYKNNIFAGGFGLISVVSFINLVFTKSCCPK